MLKITAFPRFQKYRGRISTFDISLYLYTEKKGLRINERGLV